MLYLITIQGNVHVFEMTRGIYIYSQPFSDYEIVQAVATPDSFGVAVIDSYGHIHQIDLVLDKLIPFIIEDRSIEDRLDIAVMLS